MSDSLTGASQTIRSPWNIVPLLVGAAIGLTGAAALFSAASSNDVTGTAIAGAGMLVPGLWLVFRVPFMRVTCTSIGLVNHSLFRNRRFSWQEIERVDIHEFDSMVAMATAPDLVFRGSRDPFMLTHLAGYGKRRAIHQVAAMEQWRTSQDPSFE